MSDFNLMQWEQFVNKGLEEMLDKNKYIDNDIKITYELAKKEQLIANTASLSGLINNKSTYTKDVFVNVIIEQADGSRFESVENVLTIPAYVEQGFIYNGNIYELVSTYSKLVGFNLIETKTNSQRTNSAGLKYKTPVFKRSLNLNTVFGDLFKLYKYKDILEVFIDNPYIKDKNKSSVIINAGIFLSAITGKSMSELISVLGDTNIFRNTIKEVNVLSASECLDIVCKKLGGTSCSTDAEKMDYLKIRMGILRNTLNNNIRYENQMKFAQRCKGKILAEDLELDGRIYSSGLILNDTLLKLIDDSNITSLNVLDNDGAKFKVIKYSDTFEDKIITAYNWYILNSHGFEYDMNIDKVDNLEINTIDKLFCREMSNFFRLLTMEIISDKNKNNISLETIDKSIRVVHKRHKKDSLVTSLKTKNYFQQSDCTNLLYKISRSYKTTTSEGNADRWSAEKRDLTPEEYGKFCPLDSPEGTRIGINKSITYLARVDGNGIIRTPYINVNTGGLEYLSAVEEKGKVITTFDYDKDSESCTARVNGEFITVPTNSVDYAEISPAQVFSFGALQVPFIENDSPKRVEMFINQGKSALVPIRNDAPLCRTGFESIDFGVYTSKQIFEEAKKYNIDLDATSFSIDSIVDTTEERIIRFKFNDSNETTYEISLPININTMSGSLERWKLNYKKDYLASDDCIVCYDSNLVIKDVIIDREQLGYGKYHVIDKNKISKMCIGLGRNLNVAIKLEEGYTYEDAILINADTIGCGMLDTVLCHTITADINTSGNEIEKFTNNIPGRKINYIKSDGLPRIGKKLSVNDYVICKQRYSTTDNGMSKNTSIRIKQGQEGIVLNASLSTDGTKATVLIGKIHRPEQGDKMAGRHGNKGVIAKIVPAEDMPFSEDGTIADVVLTPLGVPPRMNLGQILEGVASWCAMAKGQTVVFEPFRKNNIDDLQKLVEEVGYKAVRAYRGKTGTPFDRKVNFCVMYMLTLNHLSSKKINAIGLAGNNINQITCQPQQGVRRGGGQKEGEYEVWALESMGATKVMNDFSGLQSDYYHGEKLLKNAASESPEYIDVESKNNNSYYLKALLAGIGIGIISNSKGYKFVLLTNSDIITLSDGKVSTSSKNALHSGIFEDNTFKGKRDTYGHVELGTKILNPQAISMLYNAILIGDSIATKSDIEDIKSRQMHIVVDNDGYVYKVDEATNISKTGILALVEICKKYDLDRTIEYCNSKINEIDSEGKETKSASAAKRKMKSIIANVTSIKEQYSLSSFIIDKWLVIPSGYRPESLINVDANDRNHDIDILYKNLFKIIEASNSAHELHKPKYTQDIYNAVEEFTVDSKNKRDKKYRTVLDIMNGGKHNIFRETLIGKRQKCSTRSVITVNPKLRPDTIRVPYTSILKMQSFVLTEIALKTNSIMNLFGVFETKDKERQTIERLINNVNDRNYLAQELPENSIDIFVKEINKIVTSFSKGKVMPLGRQPTLHRFNLMAFYYGLSKFKTIEIPPVICSIYNADFDGDQMWGEYLVNNKTNLEAIQKMTIYNNMINPKDSTMTLTLAHDIKAGCYYATMYKDNAKEDEYVKPDKPKIFAKTINQIKDALSYGLIKVYDFVYYKGYFTTAGRILFNALHPDNDSCDETGNFKIVKDGLIRKDDITNLVKDYYLASDNNAEETVEYIYRIAQFGFEISTVAGLSLLYEELRGNQQTTDIIEKSKKEINKLEKHYRRGFISESTKRELALKIWHKCKEKVSDSIDYDRNSNLFIYIDSGARGNKGQFTQIFGMIGNVRNAKDEEIETPVLGNYQSGISVSEYFTLCYATRKGLVATALETKVTGEATRQLVYLNTGMKIKEESCGVKPICLPLKYQAGDERFKLLNKHIAHDYEYIEQLKMYLKDDNRITTEAIEFISSNPLFSYVKTIEDNELVKLNHKLNKLSRSLILNRFSPDIKPRGGFISEEDIDRIESERLDKIQIRSTLNCASKDGICATCYGLLYDTGQKPEIGYAIGYESSQALGEPSSQITMKSFHSGTGEGSLGSASEHLKNIINCSYKSESLVSPYTGILTHLKDEEYKIGNKVLKIPNCKYNDGSFVKKGDVLTSGIINVKSFYEQTNDILATQLHLLEEYADTYYVSNVDVHARHFEICVKSQTQRVRITNPKQSEFKLNEIYTFGEVYEANEVRQENDKIEYVFEIMGIGQVVRHEDLMLSISYGDFNRKIKDNIISDKFTPARSSIGKILIGESLTDNKIIDLKIDKKASTDKKKIREQQKIKQEKKAQKEKELDESLDMFDFSSIAEEIKDDQTQMKKSVAFQ